MKKLPIAGILCGLGVAVLSLAAVTSGHGDEKSAQPGQVTSTVGPINVSETPRSCFIPLEVHDKPFERFAEVLLLAEAWDYHDAATLLDLGLQLAEGERVLLRPHKAFESGKILLLAAHIAGDRRDAATLDRLAKYAGTRKDEALNAALKEARRIAAEAPSEADRLGETLEDVTPLTLKLHQAAIRKIRALRLAGDAKQLGEFDKHLDRIPALHPGQQNHLDQEAAWARDHMAKDASLAPRFSFSTGWARWSLAPRSTDLPHEPTRAAHCAGRRDSVSSLRKETSQ